MANLSEKQNLGFSTGKFNEKKSLKLCQTNFVISLKPIQFPRLGGTNLLVIIKTYISHFPGLFCVFFAIVDTLTNYTK